MPLHEETAEQPVYEIVRFRGVNEEPDQYGKYFIDKDQAEQVAKLLNEEDDYNHVSYSDGWTVLEIETVSQNAAFFLAYNVTLTNKAWYKEPIEGKYEAGEYKSKVVQSFLPFDDSYQYSEGVWKDRWEVTLWARTPEELQVRAKEVLDRLNESNYPGALHIL
jgi:hypothetical protein